MVRELQTREELQRELEKLTRLLQAVRGELEDGEKDERPND